MYTWNHNQLPISLFILLQNEMRIFHDEATWYYLSFVDLSEALMWDWIWPDMVFCLLVLSSIYHMKDRIGFVYGMINFPIYDQWCSNIIYWVRYCRVFPLICKGTATRYICIHMWGYESWFHCLPLSHHHTAGITKCLNIWEDECSSFCYSFKLVSAMHCPSLFHMGLWFTCQLWKSFLGFGSELHPVYRFICRKLTFLWYLVSNYGHIIHFRSWILCTLYALCSSSW